MSRKLVRDMSAEEHEAFKKDLQQKKELIRSMTSEERAEYFARPYSRGMSSPLRLISW